MSLLFLTFSLKIVSWTGNHDGFLWSRWLHGGFGVGRVEELWWEGVRSGSKTWGGEWIDAFGLGGGGLGVGERAKIGQSWRGRLRLCVRVRAHKLLLLAAISTCGCMSLGGWHNHHTVNVLIGSEVCKMYGISSRSHMRFQKSKVFKNTCLAVKNTQTGNFVFRDVIKH